MEIKAPKERVFEKMIGKDTYKQWTAAFNPTSDFEGGWNKGDKIRFVGVTEEGKKQGMLARIEENIPNEFISIHHYGIVDGENEVTEGPMVESWTPAYENYSLSQEMEITNLMVEVDVSDEHIEYFDETWPKALLKLKEISENI